MSLPTDIVLDLHQDGLRVRIDTYNPRMLEQVQITSPIADRCHIPFARPEQLREFLRLVSEALAGR